MCAENELSCAENEYSLFLLGELRNEQLNKDKGALFKCVITRGREKYFDTDKNHNGKRDFYTQSFLNKNNKKKE